MATSLNDQMVYQSVSELSHSISYRIISYYLNLFKIVSMYVDNMENCLFKSEFPFKTANYPEFSMAMLDNQRIPNFVYVKA